MRSRWRGWCALLARLRIRRVHVYAYYTGNGWKIKASGIVRGVCGVIYWVGRFVGALSRAAMAELVDALDSKSGEQ